MSLPNTEPVALQGAVTAVLSATVALLAAFGVWDPTEEQVAGIAGVFAAIITVGTAFARSKAWSPASVAQVTAATAVALDKAEQAQTELVRVAEQRTQPVDVDAIADRIVAKVEATPPRPRRSDWAAASADDLVWAPQPPPAPPRTVGEHKALRAAAGLL